MGRFVFSIGSHIAANNTPLRRSALALAAIATIAAASSARADYNSVILYPLTPPTDFSGSIYVDSTASSQVAAGGQVLAYGFDSSGNSHAILWSAGSSAVDIGPTNLTGFTNTLPYSTDGTQQVGAAYGTAYNGNYHALFWPGTTTSASYAIDLNPANYDGSIAEAVAGTEQVGAAYGANTNENSHAILWTGTADSAVDLNPANYASTNANGTDGASQVGFAVDSTLTNGNDHAMLWTGTASSAVDLNPAAYPGSIAYGVSGTQQVGVAFGGTDGHDHAILWAGTASSAVDLTPTNLTNITDSIAYGTNGADQVGYGIDTNGANNALLWFGSGASAVDLQNLLPASGVWTDSTAYTIDSSGHIYGTADGTYDGATGTFAIEWLANAPLLGDANLNGAVDGTDFDALMNGLLNNLSGWSNGDFNGDGIVNADDVALFQLGLAAYQSGTGITVPEPANAAMMALGAVGFLFRRRR